MEIVIGSSLAVIVIGIVIYFWKRRDFEKWNKPPSS